MMSKVIINIPEDPYDIYEHALSESYDLIIDEFDTRNNPGMVRELSDLNYKEAMEIISKNKPKFTISLRENHWEFSAINLNSGGYGYIFIWIKVDINTSLEIFEKYGLK